VTIKRDSEGREPASDGRAARRAAAALLAGVLERGQPLSALTGPDTLAEAAAETGTQAGAGGRRGSDRALAGLGGSGRAQAQRLALATLRHLAAADATLAPFLQREPPPAVRQALRLAVVEHFVAGAPAHAVVNDAVALMRAGRGTQRLAGLVNAVLRRALAQPAEAWAARPPQRLPEALRGRLVAAWGAAAVAAMEAAHARGAPLDLTPRRAEEPGALAQALGAELLPTGSLRLAAGGQVSALPGYAEGAFWVQDAAAALPVRMLAPRPGERVLDLCAAPGGKTLQLAAAGARVTALDVSEARLDRLRANLARTGLAAEVVTADALRWEPPAPFDAILLDAPCTATGTIRRHPDLPHLRGLEALGTLVPLQAALIDRALGWLAPGGRLVHAVCSLLPEEGEAQRDAALARHPGLAVLPADVPGAEAVWQSAGGGLRLRPDHWAGRGGLDGFFMVCLGRRSG